jgi:hypothetical protein
MASAGSGAGMQIEMLLVFFGVIRMADYFFLSDSKKLQTFGGTRRRPKGHW